MLSNARRSLVGDKTECDPIVIFLLSALRWPFDPPVCSLKLFHLTISPTLMLETPSQATYIDLSPFLQILPLLWSHWLPLHSLFYWEENKVHLTALAYIHPTFPVIWRFPHCQVLYAPLDSELPLLLKVFCSYIHLMMLYKSNWATVRYFNLARHVYAWSVDNKWTF